MMTRQLNLINWITEAARNRLVALGCADGCCAAFVTAAMEDSTTDGCARILLESHLLMLYR
jgi:hypothetical protein